MVWGSWCQQGLFFPYASVLAVDAFHRVGVCLLSFTSQFTHHVAIGIQIESNCMKADFLWTLALT